MVQIKCNNQEAADDYRKLDGSLKKWVDKAVERLEEKDVQIGKKLNNNSYSNLAGFKELKNNKLGIRLIFKETSKNQIEIIEIVAIGKREDEKVFKIAEKRRRNRK